MMTLCVPSGSTIIRGIVSGRGFCSLYCLSMAFALVCGSFFNDVFLFLFPFYSTVDVISLIKTIKVDVIGSKDVTRL